MSLQLNLDTYKNEGNEIVQGIFDFLLPLNVSDHFKYNLYMHKANKKYWLIFINSRNQSGKCSSEVLTITKAWILS